MQKIMVDNDKLYIRYENKGYNVGFVLRQDELSEEDLIKVYTWGLANYLDKHCE